MRPLVIAHRGGAAEAPENTRTALVRALQMGVDGVEIDVHASKDGEVVVHHDPDLCPGQGAPRVRISSLTVPELLRIDLGWTHGEAFAGERAPLLAEILELPFFGRRLMIELKSETDEEDDRLAAALAQLLARTGPDAARVVGSFSSTLLRRVRARLPAERLIAVLEDPERLSGFDDLGIVGVAMDRQIATKDRIAALGLRGIFSWSWTVKTESEAESLERAGIAAWITDIPRRLLSHRGR